MKVLWRIHRTATIWAVLAVLAFCLTANHIVRAAAEPESSRGGCK